MKLASILLALLALVAGVAIAGCGDDDDEEPQTLTSGATGATGEEGGDDFASAVDEICTEASAEVATAGSEQFPEGPPTGEEADRFVEEVVIPSFQEQHDQISELTPPEGEEDAVEDLLTKLQAAIDAIEADPGAFVEGGGASAEIDAASQAAQDLGITACGE